MRLINEITMNLTLMTFFHKAKAISFHGKPIIPCSEYIFARTYPFMCGPHPLACTSFIIFSASSVSKHLNKFRSGVHLYKTSSLKKKPLARLLIVVFWLLLACSGHLPVFKKFLISEFHGSPSGSSSTVLQ